MATHSGLPADELTALKSTLYLKLVEDQGEDSGTVYHQNDILDQNVIPNRKLEILLDVTQQLVNEKLFKPVQNMGELGWVLRTPAEAKQYVLILPFTFYYFYGSGK